MTCAATVEWLRNQRANLTAAKASVLASIAERESALAAAREQAVPAAADLAELDAVVQTVDGELQAISRTVIWPSTVAAAVSARRGDLQALIGAARSAALFLDAGRNRLEDIERSIAMIDRLLAVADGSATASRKMPPGQANPDAMRSEREN